MQKLVTIILAAGEGKRMKSSAAKVAHEVCGQPMLSYVSDAAVEAGSDSLVLVLGHMADQVKKIAPEGALCVYQRQQLGTGHAVMQAQELLRKTEGTALILCGDTPAITGRTLKAAYQYHQSQGNQVTLLTADIDDPFGYGRVIRDDQGFVNAIVEEKDADPGQKKIKEINSGIYFFNIDSLLSSLSELSNTNNQGEYYLTDTVEKIIACGQKAGAYKIEDPTEILGVNDRAQLAEVERIILKRIIHTHMENGVTFHLPETCMIHKGVRIGRDTVIHPGTQLMGDTVVGEACEIGPYSKIEDGRVGNGVQFMNSVMIQSQIGDNTRVGPFAYIRPGSRIGQNIKIGDFVEIKNSVIDDNTKVPHLSYVGDADVGKGVNFGCGSVVVNYDGKKKHRTTVGDHVFIGCNANLVSPVKLNDFSYIAAGSTITDEVPEYALAVARSRQTIIEDWVRWKGLDKK